MDKKGITPEDIKKEIEKLGKQFNIPKQYITIVEPYTESELEDVLRDARARVRQWFISADNQDN